MQDIKKNIASDKVELWTLEFRIFFIQYIYREPFGSNSFHNRMELEMYEHHGLETKDIFFKNKYIYFMSILSRLKLCYVLAKLNLN